MPAGVWLDPTSDPTSPANFPRGPTSPPRPPPTSCRRSPDEARPTSRTAGEVGAGGERSRWSGARSALAMTYPQPPHFPRGPTSPPRPPPTSCRRSPGEARPTSRTAGVVGAGGEWSRWSGEESHVAVRTDSEQGSHLAQTPAELTNANLTIWSGESWSCRLEFGWTRPLTQPRQPTFLADRPRHPDRRRPRAAAHRVRLDQPHALPERSGLAASGRGGRVREVR
jgi:hypothetical protein